MIPKISYSSRKRLSSIGIIKCRWIESVFKKRICNKFIPSSYPLTVDPSDRLCGCGQSLYSHTSYVIEAFNNSKQEIYGHLYYLENNLYQLNQEQGENSYIDSINTRDDGLGGLPTYVSTIENLAESHIENWDVLSHTMLEPTNAMGIIEFQGISHQYFSQYIRLSFDTPPDAILQLLIAHWGLDLPKILISIHGSLDNFELNPKINAEFQHGLVLAANTTVTWILTHGLNTGYVKYVGHALDGLPHKNRNNIVTIGIAPWGMVQNRDELIGFDKTVQYYSIMPHSPNTFALNSHHGYFLLVDDGTVGKMGCELTLWHNLEQYLLRTNLLTLNYPICCPTVQQNRDALFDINPAIPYLPHPLMGNATMHFSSNPTTTDNRFGTSEKLPLEHRVSNIYHHHLPLEHVHKPSYYYNIFNNSGIAQSTADTSKNTKAKGEQTPEKSESCDGKTKQNPGHKSYKQKSASIDVIESNKRTNLEKIRKSIPNNPTSSYSDRKKQRSHTMLLRSSETTGNILAAGPLHYQNHNRNLVYVTPNFRHHGHYLRPLYGQQPHQRFLTPGHHIRNNRYSANYLTLPINTLRNRRRPIPWIYQPNLVLDPAKTMAISAQVKDNDKKMLNKTNNHIPEKKNSYPLIDKKPVNLADHFSKEKSTLSLAKESELKLKSQKDMMMKVKKKGKIFPIVKKRVGKKKLFHTTSLTLMPSHHSNIEEDFEMDPTMQNDTTNDTLISQRDKDSMHNKRFLKLLNRAKKSNSIITPTVNDKNRDFTKKSPQKHTSKLHINNKYRIKKTDLIAHKPDVSNQKNKTEPQTLIDTKGIEEKKTGEINNTTENVNIAKKQDAKELENFNKESSLPPINENPIITTTYFHKSSSVTSQHNYYVPILAIFLNGDLDCLKFALEYVANFRNSKKTLINRLTNSQQPHQKQQPSHNIGKKSEKSIKLHDESTHIPIIVLDGSGGICDLIALAWKQNIDREDASFNESSIITLTNFIKTLWRPLDTITINIAISDLFNLMQHKPLITIYGKSHMTGRTFDQDILCSLLKNYSKKPFDQLHLALAWDRADIAKTDIFVYGQHWPDGALENALMDALIHDQVDFIKLLLANGINIKKFLTINRLERLYNSKFGPPNTLHYLIQDVKKNKPPNYWYTMIDIGNVIDKLMGGVYRCSYGRRNFKLNYYLYKQKTSLTSLHGGDEKHHSASLDHANINATKTAKPRNHHYLFSNNVQTFLHSPSNEKLGESENTLNNATKTPSLNRENLTDNDLPSKQSNKKRQHKFPGLKTFTLNHVTKKSDNTNILDPKTSGIKPSLITMAKKSSKYHIFPQQVTSTTSTNNFYDETCFNQPFHDLMVWAVLTQRHTTALYFWQNGDEPLAKALMATKLYKSIGKEAAEDDLETDISERCYDRAKEFAKLALDLLEKCYQTKQDYTEQLLTYQLKCFSDQTCLSLAVAASHMEFISHGCCQFLLGDLWMGGLRVRKSSALKVLMGLILPCTILTLEFKTLAQLQLMPQTLEEHINELEEMEHSDTDLTVDNSHRSESGSLTNIPNNGNRNIGLGGKRSFRTNKLGGNNRKSRLNNADDHLSWHYSDEDVFTNNDDIDYEMHFDKDIRRRNKSIIPSVVFSTESMHARDDKKSKKHNISSSNATSQNSLNTSDKEVALPHITAIMQEPLKKSTSFLKQLSFKSLRSTVSHNNDEPEPKEQPSETTLTKLSPLSSYNKKDLDYFYDCLDAKDAKEYSNPANNELLINTDTNNNKIMETALDQSPAHRQQLTIPTIKISAPSLKSLVKDENYPLREKLSGDETRLAEPNWMHKLSLTRKKSNATDSNDTFVKQKYKKYSLHQPSSLTEHKNNGSGIISQLLFGNNNNNSKRAKFNLPTTHKNGGEHSDSDDQCRKFLEEVEKAPSDDIVHAHLMRKKSSVLVGRTSDGTSLANHLRKFSHKSIRRLSTFKIPNKMRFLSTTPHTAGAYTTTVPAGNHYNYYRSQSLASNHSLLLSSSPSEKLSARTKFYEFYNAPITKFWCHTLAYFFFIIVFTHVVLVGNSTRLLRDSLMQVTDKNFLKNITNSTDPKYFMDFRKHYPVNSSKYPIIPSFKKQRKFRKYLNSSYPSFLVESQILTHHIGVFSSWMEIFVLLYVLTFACEKIREAIASEAVGFTQKTKLWFSNLWNILCLCAFILFMFGFMFKMAADINLNELYIRTWNAYRKHKIFPLTLDFVHRVKFCLIWGRFFLALSAIFWYIRILDIISCNKYLGPYVVMIGKMMMDMAIFVLIMVVIMASFGIARYAIRNPLAVPKFRIFVDIFYQPYWMMYGEVFAPDINPDCGTHNTPPCIAGDWITPALMALYLLVTNILLVNLLIAVFNHTFIQVSAISHQIWKFGRFNLTIEYEMKPLLPPPFIAICHIYRAYKYIIFRHKLAQAAKLLAHSPPPPSDTTKFNETEEIKTKNYLTVNGGNLINPKYLMDKSNNNDHKTDDNSQPSKPEYGDKKYNGGEKDGMLHLRKTSWWSSSDATFDYGLKLYLSEDEVKRLHDFEKSCLDDLLCEKEALTQASLENRVIKTLHLFEQIGDKVSDLEDKHLQLTTQLKHNTDLMNAHIITTKAKNEHHTPLNQEEVVQDLPYKNRNVKSSVNKSAKSQNQFYTFDTNGTTSTSHLLNYRSLTRAKSLTIPHDASFETSDIISENERSDMCTDEYPMPN